MASSSTKGFTFSRYSVFGVVGLTSFLLMCAIGLAIWALVLAYHPPSLSVEERDIQDGAVSTRTIATGAVTSAKIADGSIGTADLADNSVTHAKLDGITKVNSMAAQATHTLTEAANAGFDVLNIVADHTADQTINVPAPSKAGVTYRFVYGGDVAEAQAHIFDLPATVGFVGALVQLGTSADTSESELASNFITFGSSSTLEDIITLHDAEAYDLTFTATSTTRFQVSGFIVSTSSTSNVTVA